MSVLKVYESRGEEQRKKKASRGHTEAAAAVCLVEAVISVQKEERALRGCLDLAHRISRNFHLIFIVLAHCGRVNLLVFETFKCRFL